MVDRYKSLLGSQVLADNIDRNMKVDQVFNYNMEMIRRTNNHATKMREYISKYKRDISKDDGEFVAKFKQEQREYAKDRNYLKSQVDKLEKNKKKDTPQYNFIKKQLIKAIKNELDLEFQLNQQITNRKQQKQKLKMKLFDGSQQIKNAVRDIEAKKQQILYLQRLINECLQLLQIIGVLVNEQGQKIDTLSDQIQRANLDIEKAQRNIDKAIIAQQKSRCKWCCILILAIIVIVMGIILYVVAFR